MPTIEEMRKQRQARMQSAAPASTPAPSQPLVQQPAFVSEPAADLDFGWKPVETEQDEPEWQALRQNKQFIETVKRYAKNVEDADFSSDEQVFDWFVGDRRWKDSNTFSTLKELNYVKGTFGAKYASPEDLKDLAVIREEWDKLPGGFTRMWRGATNLDGGRIAGGAGAILENVAKGTLDPTIIFGGLAGKAMGAAVSRGSNAAVRQGVKRALQTGTSISTDFGVSAGANVAYQEVNVEAKLQKEVSGWEALVAGGVGAALSTPSAITTFAPKKGDLSAIDFKRAAEQALRKDAELRAKGTTDYFGGKGPRQTSDGRKLSLDDVDLMKKANDPSYKAPGEDEASMTDLGYDVTNVANNTVENINLARALHDTLPGMWMGKDDFFKWWGKNNERVINFFHGQRAEADPKVVGKRKYKDFDDEMEIAINARVFQETFPELFQDARRGVVSGEQAAKEAVKLGKGNSLDQNIDNIVNTPVGYAANSSEMAFVKLTIGAIRDDMRKLKTKALNVTKSMSDTELDDVEQEIARRSSQQVMLFAKQAGFETEAGRSLQATGVSPADSLGKFTKVGVKGVRLLTGTAKSKEERVAMLQDLGKAMDMLDPENTQQLDLFVANMHANRGNLSDVFYEMYYNWGLLSNPSTQVINLMGNVATGSLDMTERLIAAGTMPSEMRPLAKRFEGYMHAIPDAWKAAWRAYKTEMPSDPQTRLENMDKAAIPSFRISKDGISKAGVGEEGWVFGGRQVRIPGRLLLAMDDGMKLLHQRAYMYDQMLRAADEKKLTGADRKAFYANFLKSPPSEVMQGALEEARRLTYTDKLGPGLRGFQQFIDAVPGGRLVIPFVRTPAKILGQAADMMSLPFLSEKWLSTSRTAADFAEGGFARRRAEARIFIGYSMLGMGAYMAANGMATGPSPSDPGERAAFETNKIAWGVRSGNEWVQINRFDPIAIPFTFGVGLEKTVESMVASGTGLEREESYLATMAGFLSDAVLDKSFFQGVENVVGAVMEPNRKGESFAKGVVRSFTPAIAAGYARSVDPRVAAPMTFMEVIQDRIGFDERKKVPTRVDAFGRDVWNEVPGSYRGDTGALSVVNRFVNPFKAKSGANDPVANELYDLGVKLLPPRNKKYKDIELDSAQAYVLNKATGKMFHSFVKDAMSKPEWKGYSNYVKRSQIDLFKEMSAQYGQMMFEGTYPDVVRRSYTENKDMKKLTAPTRSETMEYLKPNSKR